MSLHAAVESGRSVALVEAAAMWQKDAQTLKNIATHTASTPAKVPNVPVSFQMP